MNTFKFIMFLPTRQLFLYNLFCKNNSLKLLTRRTYSSHVRQDEILKNFINSQQNISTTKLKKLKQDVLNLGIRINTTNYDAYFIGFCHKGKRIDIAKKYFEILKTENKIPNNATVGKFLKLYYLVYYDQLIGEDIENEIDNLCESFKRTNNILDPLSAENAILALSLTKYWKKCLSYLDNIRYIDIPSSITYSVIIEAAFKNNEITLAWDLLKEMLDRERVPTINIYKGIVSYCNENSTASIGTLEKLFNILQKYAIIPPEEFAELLLQISSKINITVTLTKVNDRGKCIKCNNLLPKTPLSSEEFQLLQNAFFNNVMTGKNIFTKTTPNELKNFMSFIKQNGPFDIIIDGLNVMFSSGKKNPTGNSYELLANVAKHFIERNKNVLIIGRDHMKRKNITQLIKNVEFFFAQDLSEDDPFLIYATMYNGPNTGFVSRDLMRNHLYKLQDQHLKILFRRWQNYAQYKLIYVDDNGTVHITEPPPYLVAIQKYNNYWHIPLENTNADISNENLLQWICLKKPSV